MKSKNLDYWLSKKGFEYEYQQQGRTQAGDITYKSQEQWLLDYIRVLAGRSYRSLRVLDYGCGFGRFARLLSKEANIEYYGFDISSTMVQPLLDRPPIELNPIESRVKIGKTLDEAFPSISFDFIFTVSVMMHQEPKSVPEIISSFRRHLSPDGKICLIENKTVPFSFLESNWHDGCWLHNHIGEGLLGLNVDLYTGFLPNHDIYISSEAKGKGRQLQIADKNNTLNKITEDELKVLGISRLQQSVLGMNAMIDHENKTSGRELELNELNGYLKKEIESLHGQLQKQNNALTRRSDLSRVLTRLDFLSAHPAPIERNDLKIDRVANEYNEAIDNEEFDWNASRDVNFAHQDTRFAKVCHVFHKEWHGIRSASGSLPGNKLAISENQKLSADAISNIANKITAMEIKKIIMHGFSKNMKRLMEGLRKFGFENFYLVWHGTTAQLAYSEEIKLAQSFFELVKEKKIRKFHTIRVGFGDALSDLSYRPQLLNLYPNVMFSKPNLGIRSEDAIAIAPSWNNVGKNLYANILAAENMTRVRKTWIFADNIELPAWLSTKIERLPKVVGHEIFGSMRACDIVLNATLIDCHPMVDMEALAVNRPVVIGPLFLDGLESHPYTKLTTVQNPLSVSEIQRVADTVLSISGDELYEMMASYKSNIKQLSLTRYTEFLEI